MMKRLISLTISLTLITLFVSVTFAAEPTAEENVCTPSPANQLTVTAVTSTYTIAPRKPISGFFETGQAADLMLSGVGFNQTGGSLLFNHPSNIATDGTRLLLVDRNNNRVLVWTTLPTANTPPDLVLGQANFETNAPGTTLAQMNWPSAVSVAQGKLVVADTENDRILIWLTFPTKNGQSADFSLNLREIANKIQVGLIMEWPWGVWTDGTKLMVSATQGQSGLLIWQTFPQNNTIPPDIVVRNTQLGTPRYIISDGKRVVVFDHNAGGSVGMATNGSFIWKSFPTQANQAADVILQPPYAIVGGVFTPEGQLVGIGNEGAGKLMIWNTLPTTNTTPPDLEVKTTGLVGGDGMGMALAGKRLYMVSSNSNKISVYNSLPTQANQLPDFSIGGNETLCGNTLDDNFFMTNPVPQSNGKNLFVSSDFDHKLYVWNNLPDQNGVHPNWVYNLTFQPWDNALWKDTFILGGQSTVLIWKQLPLNGLMPSLTFTQKIGNVTLNGIMGVAVDEQYFYLQTSENQQGKLHVWAGIPTANSNPLFSLTLSDTATQRLDSDGVHLVRTSLNNKVEVYDVATLSATATPQVVKPFEGTRVNLPNAAITIGDHLLIADTSNNRVLGWHTLSNAIANKPADFVIGEANLTDVTPEIGANKVFMPGGMAFDGSYLWLGEFKFSGRLLRYSHGVSVAGQASYLPLILK